MHEFAASGKSKNHFLHAVFNAIGSSIQEQDDVDLSDNKTEHRIREKVVEFADYLIDNFFLPPKKAKQLSQAVYNYSTPSTPASGQSRSSTTDGQETLGDACLGRDNRCVVSRRFDSSLAMKRLRKSEHDAQDEDGQPLKGQPFSKVEVPRILPHSLRRINSHREPVRSPALDKVSHCSFAPHHSRKESFRILNMIDDGMNQLIQGPDIDRGSFSIF
ncbi:hypothetical protein VB005_08217 [Metarhizium brunneum]